MTEFERPSGYITGWYGNIPDGYIICNGKNGTPDLSELPRTIVARPKEYQHLTIGGEILGGETLQWIMKQ